MSNTAHLKNKEAIQKLKSLIDEIKVCLFSTQVSTDDGSTCRPMSALEVSEDGNIWFFSEKTSEKNRDIASDNKVRLYFSHPAKNSYLVVNGEAKIISDQSKIEELWTPAAKIWFEEGKEDPDLSVIKVTSTIAYYWDTEDSQMINFLKMAASVATGSNLISGKQGALKV